MKIPKHKESDDIDDFYSSLLSGQIPGRAWRPRNLLQHTPGAKRIKKRYATYKQKQIADEGQFYSSQRRYENTLLGAGKPAVRTGAQKTRTHDTQPKTQPKRLQLKKLSRRKSALIGVPIVLTVGFFAFITTLRKEPESTISKGLTPLNTFVPTKLPAGFTVGSSLESLQNGAQLYTIYSDKGHKITVTQQAKADNFSAQLPASALRFTTPLGKGYIVEAPGRITGYIVASDSLLLFNSTSSIEATSLKSLMESFESY